MGTHVLLTLLNKLRKINKILGLQRIINSIIQEHEC